MPTSTNSLTPSFSLICTGVTLDAYSKKWSFFNITDEFIFENAPDQSDFNENSPVFVPLAFKIVLRWLWTPLKETQEGAPEKATVRFISPKGNTLVEENDIPFVRSIFRPDHYTGVIEVRNFPVSAWGRYEISVTPDGFSNSSNSVFLTIGRTIAKKKSAAKKKKNASKKKTGRKKTSKKIAKKN